MEQQDRARLRLIDRARERCKVFKGQRAAAIAVSFGREVTDPVPVFLAELLDAEEERVRKGETRYEAEIPEGML